MTSLTQQTPHDFAQHMAVVLQDETQLKHFVETVTDGPSLKAFAAAQGYDLPAAEAERLIAQAGALVSGQSDQGPISDDQLETVSGGFSWAAAGGILGGLGGAAAVALAVGCIIAAPVTGGVSLAGAVAALGGLSAGAAGTVVAGSLVTGAFVGGLGAAGGHLVDQSL